MRKRKDPIDSRAVIVGFIATAWASCRPTSMLERPKARRDLGRGLMPPEGFPE